MTTVMAERGFDVYTYDKGGKYAQGSKECLIPRDWEALAANREKYADFDVRRPNSVGELVRSCEAWSSFSGVYFVAVPTPMAEDGSCDTSIVESVLDELASVPGERIAVIKSTVPPGSTEAWNKKYEATGLRIIFSPEFLTENNALDDMRNQNRIVLGGPRPHINKVKQIFQSAFPKVPIVKTNSTTAEMVKYFTNVQLAVRVVLSCEISQICQALDKNGLNIDYDKVLEYANYDKRLGNSHMNAQGNDGISGSRGHCFPKDTNALIALAKSIGVKPTVMAASWEKNLEIVPSEHRDWEKMVGRAVSNKKENKD